MIMALEKLIVFLENKVLSPKTLLRLMKIRFMPYIRSKYAKKISRIYGKSQIHEKKKI